MLDTSKAARFSDGAPSTTSFDGPLLAVTANCRCGLERRRLGRSGNVAYDCHEQERSR